MKEIESLHKTRNDVQHDSKIPSDDDLSRYIFTTMYLLDEICATVFENKVTFETISLAFIIQSEIEKIILYEMDKAIESKRYGHCVLFAEFVINYHKGLIQKKIQPPTRISNNPLTFLPTFGNNLLIRTKPELEKYDKALKIISDYLKGVDEAIEWLISMNILPEYQNEISNVFGTLPFYGLKDEDITEEKAIQARLLAYRIITETQWQLNNVSDSEIPQIFYCKIIFHAGKPSLYLGIASTSSISRSVVKAFNEDNGRDFPV